MSTENPFVSVAMQAAKDVLAGDLLIKRGASILYKIEVDNNLDLTVDPHAPKRGQSAFQTDLCIFEKNSIGVDIPRVVIEFKKNISTHDVLTYSSKAGKHKQVYPYLRYGLLISELSTIPKRVYSHNEFLDFVICSGGFHINRLHQLFENLLKKEIRASRVLESIHFQGSKVYLFRNEIEVSNDQGNVY